MLSPPAGSSVAIELGRIRAPAGIGEPVASSAGPDGEMVGALGPQRIQAANGESRVVHLQCATELGKPLGQSPLAALGIAAGTASHMHHCHSVLRDQLGYLLDHLATANDQPAPALA